MIKKLLFRLAACTAALIITGAAVSACGEPVPGTARITEREAEASSQETFSVEESRSTDGEGTTASEKEETPAETPTEETATEESSTEIPPESGSEADETIRFFGKKTDAAAAEVNRLTLEDTASGLYDLLAYQAPKRAEVLQQIEKYELPEAAFYGGKPFSEKKKTAILKNRDLDTLREDPDGPCRRDPPKPRKLSSGGCSGAFDRDGDGRAAHSPDPSGGRERSCAFFGNAPRPAVGYSPGAPGAAGAGFFDCRRADGGGGR